MYTEVAVITATLPGTSPSGSGRGARGGGAIECGKQSTTGGDSIRRDSSITDTGACIKRINGTSSIRPIGELQLHGGM